MMHPTFRQLARHLVSYHPPKDEETVHHLELVRASFGKLIDEVAPLLPEGPDATLAARAIHDACQRCLAAIVLNQPEEATTP